MPLSDAEYDWVTGLLDDALGENLQGWDGQFTDDLRQKVLDEGHDAFISGRMWKQLVRIASKINHPLPD